MWVVRDEMGISEVTRAFHNTGRPHNSILRSTYSGHVRSGSLDSVMILRCFQLLRYSNPCSTTGCRPHRYAPVLT